MKKWLRKKVCSFRHIIPPVSFIPHHAQPEWETAFIGYWACIVWFAPKHTLDPEVVPLVLELKKFINQYRHNLYKVQDAATLMADYRLVRDAVRNIVEFSAPEELPVYDFITGR